MDKIVPLRIVRDAFEMVSGEWTQYLDVEKAEIFSLPEDDSLYDDEEIGELEEMIDAGYGTRFFRLPQDPGVRENRLVGEFVRNLAEGKVREQLEDILHADGAVRRFREAVRELGIEEDWRGFREKAWSRAAAEWCEKHGIEYTE